MSAVWHHVCELRGDGQWRCVDCGDVFAGQRPGRDEVCTRALRVALPAARSQADRRTVRAYDVDRLSTHELSELTGVTFRRLDYWCRVGILVPARAADGSGTRREFERSHVKVAMAIDEMMAFAPGGTTTLRTQVFDTAMRDIESMRGGSWVGRSVSLSKTDFVTIVVDLEALEGAAAVVLAEFDASFGLVRAS